MFAFLLCIVINSAAAFLPYLLEDVGVSSSRYGVITAYMATLEIPMLLAARPLRRRAPLYALCIASGFSYAAACLLLGTCAHSLGMIVAIETLSGVGSGLLIASAANYIYTLTPENLKATGQSIYVAATALSGIAGNLIGGAVVDALSAPLLYCIMGVTGLISALFLLGTIVIGAKLLKQSPPERA